MSVDGDPEYDVDFRERPERYEIGWDGEGVFKVQPYKDELLPLWMFETPEKADKSAEAIHGKYEEYRADGDFPGMDMARKYHQMGYTRAMRYARYPDGKKYVGSEAQCAPNTNSAERTSEDHSSGQSPRENGETVSGREERDPQKRESVLRFEERLECVREDETYRRAKVDHRER